MSAAVQVPAHAAAYVQFVDQDPAFDLVAAVKSFDDQKSNAELVQLVEQQKYSKVLERVVQLLPAAAKASTEEFELVFHLFFAMLEREEVTAAQRASLVPALVQQLASDAAQHSVSKVKLLISLFNLLPPEHGLRAPVLLALLETALASQQTALISPRTLEPARLDAWRAAWKPAPTAAQWTQLLLRLAQVLVAQQNHSTARVYWIRYLQSIESSSAQDLAAAQPNILSALSCSLSVPSSAQFDEFFALGAVQKLDKSHASLVSLLRSLSSGSVADSLSTIDSNQAYWTNLGLSADALREKARLLSLCDLAQQQQRWALAELAGRLSLGSAWDAERLVVRASSLNLLGAKIDQETDLVTFEHAINRQRQVDWAQLRGKVHAWRDSVNTVLKAFAQSREAAPAILQRM